MDAAADICAPGPSTRALLVETTATLTAAGVSSARLDAEVLLAAACGVERTQLYTRGNQPVPAVAVETFQGLLARRLQREPLQYIVGRQEFWSLDIAVNPAVLIPRPETELLVELALEILPLLKRGNQGELERPLTICDLGTGSGCIAVALAHELPTAEIWAVDRSAGALAAARENARRLGAERVRFVAGDLFAATAGTRFDAIVCNPPYIATSVLDGLQPELAWEPRAALDGGADGLEVIRGVIAAAPMQLESDGWLIMEIGADQKAAVLEMAGAARLRELSVRDDYAGQPRVLLARL